MISLDQRIDTLAALGRGILSPGPGHRLGRAIARAHRENPWFTPQFCAQALDGVAREWLNPGALRGWIAPYPIGPDGPPNPKRVAVVMAGNVPLVGFHDMLCVLIAGHRFVGKVSSRDGGLMQALAQELIALDPRWAPRIEFAEERLHAHDAVIATGSNNSARYFEHYFRGCPRIIRRNRHSVAVLGGNERPEDLEQLAHDIFTYFGLGCRSVSKVLLPEGFDLARLMDALEGYRHLGHHNKYANNYEYHRALFLMNAIPHLDNGFVLLTPSPDLGSPVGVLYYDTYRTLDQVNGYLRAHQESLQCVVSQCPGVLGAIALGRAQQPALTDYADGVDTLAFLNNLA